jgi:putative transcriptional regulator
MSKIVTSGPRRLVDDAWHDDTGPLPGSPADWDPPMTEDEVMIAALSDPDAQPLSSEQLANMRRRPLARFARQKARMTAQDFAARFRLDPVELDAWETGQSEPPSAIVAYLTIIAADPNGVLSTLEGRRAATAAE